MPEHTTSTQRLEQLRDRRRRERTARPAGDEVGQGGAS